MRLGFHYHIPAIHGENGIYMPGVQGRFIESLAEHFEKVVCLLHSPRPEEVSWMDYRIEAQNVSLLDIGLHTSVMDRTIKSQTFTSLLHQNSTDLDVILLRGPSPLLPAMAAVSSLPTVLLLVGDYVSGVNDLHQPRWRKEAIRLWSYWNKWGQTRVASRSLTFVNSRVLYDELKGKISVLRETRTTTLTKNDFFVRSDTCQSTPYRLLYVGRMDRTKGLLDMVEAVSLIVEHGEDITLDLVGWPEHNDPILDEIKALSKLKGIEKRINYLGVRPLGPELFTCYKQADIFIIASLFEGFPRAIWEAMAHSLPVVATRVGSIPAFIEGAAELVQPGNISGLAEAITRIIHQPELRRQLIQRGLPLARQNTLEEQTSAMVMEMQKWLETIHG
jgi:glycosyltransferase involved in cell wall biosynthesis